MSAAKSQKNADIPADLQPYYNAPSTSRVWARWAVRIVAVIILLCLAVLFVRWVWHQTHSNDTSKPAASSSQTAKKGTTDQKAEPSTLGGSSEGNNSSSQQSSSTTSTTSQTNNSGTATQTVGQSTNLSNTGPGDTLAIFVAVSVFSALLYELRLRRQH